jgi:hypothetical protein
VCAVHLVLAAALVGWRSCWRSPGCPIDSLPLGGVFACRVVVGDRITVLEACISVLKIRGRSEVKNYHTRFRSSNKQYKYVFFRRFYVQAF